MLRSTLSFLLPRAPPWRTRFPEFAAHCRKWRCRLMLREHQWVQTVTNYFSKVPIQCLQCKAIVTTTKINNFINRGQLGCLCLDNKPWSNRYKEFLTHCRKRGCRLMVASEA